MRLRLVVYTVGGAIPPASPMTVSPATTLPQVLMASLTLSVPPPPSPDYVSRRR